ncbi:MAG TPA: MFS transporter [Thermoleophilaceae bacterium]|nr:MFS transporter [Thermoleophilaceae bacterium]
MSSERLTRTFILLRALRWLPVGLVLPFLILTPVARGLELGAVGAVFAVHSAVLIVLEVPSGALADSLGRRRVLLVGAVLTAASLATFAVAQSVPAFIASVAALGTGRALISGALEAWYVDSLRALDPVAPLARGLSRGTAAEAIALGLGALAGGALVSLADPANVADGALAGYGLAALVGAGAALVYLAAVAVLVREPPHGGHLQDAGHSAARRIRMVFATARSEIAASTTVRVIFATAVAFGFAMSAVELLWQPHLAQELGGGARHGFAFGALAAGAMLAVALGAASSPRLRGRLGLRRGYLAALGVVAVSTAALGEPGAPLGFVAVYLATYLSYGFVEPMHVELLNEAVGSDARATLISGESLAVQGGALVANLSVGALAAAEGTGTAWAVAGAFLAVTGVLVARPLRRGLERQQAA